MSAQSPWEFAHELQEQYRLDVPDIVLNVYDALAVNVIGALPAELSKCTGRLSNNRASHNRTLDFP
jgi:hypothetical protein